MVGKKQCVRGLTIRMLQEIGTDSLPAVLRSTFVCLAAGMDYSAGWQVPACTVLSQYGDEIYISSSTFKCQSSTSWVLGCTFVLICHLQRVALFKLRPTCRSSGNSMADDKNMIFYVCWILALVRLSRGEEKTPLKVLGFLQSQYCALPVCTSR